MSSVTPAATPLPIANATRLNVMYTVDADGDYRITAADGLVGKAVMELTAQTTEVSFDQLQAWVGSFDVANRIGLPRPDGALDQAEQGRLELSILQMVEHQNAALSPAIAQWTTNLFPQVDANRDQKINAADNTPLARAILKMANNTTELTPAGFSALLTRYDVFDAANNRAGADGKLGQLIEFELFKADLSAAAQSVAKAEAEATGGGPRWR